MTKPTYCKIAEIGKFNGKEVLIKGWLYNKRSSGKINFLLIRDGSGILQAVMTKDAVSEKTFSSFDSLTQESSLMVSGKVREDKRALGGYELEIKEVEIIQISKDYPITPKEHGVAFLMENRHLWLRSSRQLAILSIRNEIIFAIRKFFYDKKFVLIDAPILTGSIGETATTLFETQYFDLGKAYLAQTGQLYMEAACMALGNVYCFGPTFRAEKSKTRRHLTEFWMIEAEEAFYDNNDNMTLQEELIEYIVTWVLEKCQKELEVIERDTTFLKKVKRPFPRITYEEAIKLLQSQGAKIKFGEDVGGDEETTLANAYDKPFCVYNYPKKIKAFYMKPHPEREDLVLNNDMLAPEGYGEIIGGSQRNDDYDSLITRIKEERLPLEAYEWYLDLRKYGSVPHSGFGLGLERTVSWICGLPHVREAIPFPRMLYRLYP
ncbi:MAG: asparagine--tRNA ligase [candidate division Zixibacteria bacterium RBG_16_40_9]|nr:MAG: asparagine--tRNA ligase [candidate division Zixibacteria bacterium RBG_16_40_9]